MGFFDVDFGVKAWQFLPVRLRQAIQYAWAKVCVSGVVYMAGIFRTNRDANLYDLAHNGQVCKMEAVLNDVFDNVARTIYITDPAYIDPVYLYRRSELKPVYLYRRSESSPVYLYRRSECYDGSGVQFIVNVPAALYGAIDLSRMRALIEKYRLVSKTNYIIVSV